MYIPMFSCAHIKCQPTPCWGDQRLCDRCQGGGILTADSFGDIPMRETTIFFPVLVPRSFSKLSQYVSTLCFILFLGRSYHWCVIPFCTNAPNSWPTCSHRYSTLTSFMCFLILLLYIFLFCATSLGTFLSKLSSFFLFFFYSWHLPKYFAMSGSQSGGQSPGPSESCILSSSLWGTGNREGVLEIFTFVLFLFCSSAQFACVDDDKVWQDLSLLISSIFR